MSARPDDRFRSALRPGETIRWSGRPPQGLRLRWPDLYMIPFSLLWSGLLVSFLAPVLFSEALTPRDDRPFMVLFLFPFVLMALYLTVGRFWVDGRQRSQTAYVVTDERIGILSGLFRLTLTLLDLDTLRGLTLNEKGDGRGTILFGPPSVVSSLRRVRQMQGGWTSEPMFDTVGDARAVHGLILDLQRASRL